MTGITDGGGGGGEAPHLLTPPAGRRDQSIQLSLFLSRCPIFGGFFSYGRSLLRPSEAKIVKCILWESIRTHSARGKLRSQSLSWRNCFNFMFQSSKGQPARHGGIRTRFTSDHPILWGTPRGLQSIRLECESSRPDGSDLVGNRGSTNGGGSTEKQAGGRRRPDSKRFSQSGGVGRGFRVTGRGGNLDAPSCWAWKRWAGPGHD